MEKFKFEGNISDSKEYLGVLAVIACNAIIFSDNSIKRLEEVGEYLDVESISFLELLLNVADGYKHQMDSAMKKNLENLISYYRYDVAKKYPELKSEIFKKSNDLLSIANTSDDSKFVNLIADEVKERFGSLKMYFLTRLNATDAVPYIKLLLSDDFDTLILLTEYSDEEFKEILNEVSELEFLFSVNFLLNILPELLDDKNVYNRLSIIYQEIDRKIKSGDEDVYSLFEKKDADRVIKIYTNYLK